MNIYLNILTSTALAAAILGGLHFALSCTLKPAFFTCIGAM